MAKEKNKKESKRDDRNIAQMLYLQGMLQKEIALKLSRSEKTISSWKNEDNWDYKKTNIMMSRNDRLSELYQELAEFNRKIQDKEDYKVADSKEADARRKLIKDIRELETKYNVAETISIGRDFCNYLKDIDFDFAMQVMESYEGFVNQTIQKQKWQE
jgi:uncharacterized protein YjcR